MTTRLFPFRLFVAPAGAQPYHTPIKTREDMKKAIDTLVKARTVGSIVPQIFVDGEWEADAPSVAYMASFSSGSRNGQHKPHFKAAAALFAQLAKLDTLSDEQKSELYEVVGGAFDAAGIAFPISDDEPEPTGFNTFNQIEALEAETYRASRGLT